jgi:hypothetical protein
MFDVVMFDVVMLRCGDVTMWGCYDVVMFDVVMFDVVMLRCGDVRCGDVRCGER